MFLGLFLAVSVLGQLPDLREVLLLRKRGRAGPCTGTRLDHQILVVILRVKVDDIKSATPEEAGQFRNQWVYVKAADVPGLPEGKRLTRTHVRVDKTARLLESGLLGPVRLMTPSDGN